MPKKKILLSVASFVLLIAVALGVYLYCEQHLKTREVYIARYDLPGRTLLSEEEIEKVRVPSLYLNEEVCLEKEDIIGRYVKIDTSIPKGSFFYEGALDSFENMKDKVNGLLKEGEVSYDLYLNEIKMNQAYLLKGMYVDIYLTINRERVLSDLLINNIRIIGLYDVSHNEIKDHDQNAILESICLAVPKDSVAYLNKAKAIGELSLTIGDNTYQDVVSKLNKDASVFAYIE